jgi:pimeloyl-ACP methyl ester carboxylesterase
MEIAPLKWFLALLCSAAAAVQPDWQSSESVYLLRGSNKTEVNARISSASGFVQVAPSWGQGQRPAKYDPILWTIAAGLKSREFDRGNHWREILLNWPPTAEGAYYQKPVPAHVLQEGKPETLILLLSSTYSTWERGSWVNQLVSICRKLQPSAHFLGLGGFLTSEMLGADPAYPPITGEEIAEDLYVRIHAVLDRWEKQGLKYNRVLLMGASGGASLVLHLLAQDAKAHSRFTGGVAFNPILDTDHAFDLLDSSVDKIVHEQKFPEQMGLTNTTPQSIGMLLNGMLRRGSFNPTPSAPEILALTAFDANLKARSEATLIKRLFFNEFIATDLKSTASASHSRDFNWDWDAEETPAERLPWNQGNRHAHYFKRYAFQRHQFEGRVTDGMSFAQYTSIFPTIEAIAAPVYIVFPSDDPVLSENQFSTLLAPTVVLERLEKITEAKQNIRWFSPSFGGHLGYFLDDGYLEGVVREALQ